MTFDQWFNPIQEVRDWPIFNITTPKLTGNGGNFTWTVNTEYYNNGRYMAEIVWRKANLYDNLLFTFKNSA